MYQRLKSPRSGYSVWYARRDITKCFGLDGEYIITFVWPCYSVRPD